MFPLFSEMFFIKLFYLALPPVSLILKDRHLQQGAPAGNPQDMLRLFFLVTLLLGVVSINEWVVLLTSFLLSCRRQWISAWKYSHCAGFLRFL